MLCEKCQEREAHIIITKMVNGVSETHNLCENCAGAFSNGEENNIISEWSKAIFKMLSDAVTGPQDAMPSVPEEQKKLACPNCQKTYEAFLENGKLGCPECFEVFQPYISQTAMRIQGADTHTGKSKTATKKKEEIKVKTVHEKLSSEEEIKLLTDEMNAAVAMEDYKRAAKLRDQIQAIKEKKNG